MGTAKPLQGAKGLADEWRIGATPTSFALGQANGADEVTAIAETSQHPLLLGVSFIADSVLLT